MKHKINILRLIASMFCMFGLTTSIIIKLKEGNIINDLQGLFFIMTGIILLYKGIPNYEMYKEKYIK